jgi:acetyl-CoA carboxylase/biotin carboxylase 1
MATPDDLKANAEYIRFADEVVDVPGGTNNNNYANITLICSIAERLRVDAVMPMWGHASENPALPTSLAAIKSHRVSFIGPPAGPMQALGDKIGSTIIAQSAGVPVIGWNGDGIVIDYAKDGLTVETYAKADVRTSEEALLCANRLGYPVMIKASEGGGGKGIRKVLRSEDVPSLFRQVQAEVPGSPIFVMRMAKKARHLEVQLLADKHGNAIALSGRDCSVQRRHQKIVEEGPPIAAPKELFSKMEASAVALAKAVGYVNAGTVEFLYLEETQTYAFLELNPRLQVEHPVTENILGINLPCCQLQVAMGIPLHRIGDVRKLYGRHVRGADTIDFDYAERAVPPRHCIAIRITAENPEAAFRPTGGHITELKFMSSIDVWGYFSVDSSGCIHEFADSQFGHIFASGPNRESARRACLVALKELQIRGSIRTTTEYIIKLMQSDDFVQNRIDTDWLDGRISNYAALSVQEDIKFALPATLVAICGSALQGYQFFEQRDIDFMDNIKVGHVPPLELLTPSVPIDLIFNGVKYQTLVVQSSERSVIVKCNKRSHKVEVRPLSDKGYLIQTEGKSHIAYSINESGGALRVTLDGHTCMFTPEYDPTRLTSTVAGKLARHLVRNGSHVNKGDPYVEVEVMKMYMPLKADESGTVTFEISEGAALSPGDLIASMALDHPDKVVKAEIFTGKLNSHSDQHDIHVESATKLPHLKRRDSLNIIECVLKGYPQSSQETESALIDLMSSISDPLTPFFEVEESMSVLRGRIDGSITNKILEINDEHKRSVESGNSKCVYPAKRIIEALNSYALELDIPVRNAFYLQTSTLWKTVEQYLYTNEVRILSALMHAIEEFLRVEIKFDKLSFTDVVTELRKSMINDVPAVLSMCRSHSNISAKNVLLLRILDEMKNFPLGTAPPQPQLPTGVFIREEINIRQLKMRLSEISKLRQNIYSQVSFGANLLLMEQFSLKPELRRQRLDEAINAALTTGDAVGMGDRLGHMSSFLRSNIVIRDLLLDALQHDKDYRIAAMEIYIRKMYQKTHGLNKMRSGYSLVGDGVDQSSWIQFEFETSSIRAVSDSSVGASPSFATSSTRSELAYADLVELQRRPRSASNSGLGTDPSPIDAVMSSLPPTPTRTPSVSRSNSPPPEESRTSRSGINGRRLGVFAVVDSFDRLPSLFPHILAKIPISEASNASFVNAVHIVLMRGVEGGAAFDDDCAALLGGFLASQKDGLKQRLIRRVSFLVGQPGKRALGNFGSVFTFRAKSEYTEDKLYRHIEAPHAFHLDLPQLSQFDLKLETGVQTTSGNVHIYLATPIRGQGPPRYFARLVSFASDTTSSDAETLFVEALDSLGLVLGQRESQDPGFRRKSAANHVFLNVVAPESVIDPNYYSLELGRICTKYWYKMVHLAISKVELKLTCKVSALSQPLNIRMVASNPTGFVLKIHSYYEADVNRKIVFKSINGPVGPLDGLPTDTPYEVSEKFEQQRALALASSDTLYAYDWPVLFEEAVKNQWAEYDALKGSSSRPEGKLFSALELVLCQPGTETPLAKGWTADDAMANSVIVPLKRAPGQNECGMIAWLVVLKTPEFPNGRQCVLICNDITFQAGSFGTREDVLFYMASQYARRNGIPRMYLAANSGARIGMAQSLKSQFQICWTDANDPGKGFQYIFINKDVYGALLNKYKGNMDNFPVRCTLVDGSDGRMRIDDIIGEEEDLGVENLMGSGLIAGETARAYDEIFTLTLVVGRTVGIGAYLVRLGQRTIQRTRNSPIILTGHQALNKLMGRDIYSANDQLGGPMIMFPNGVSHLLAEDHMESVNKALNWLSFVPAVKGGPLAVRDMSGIDSVERTVEFAPQKGLTYDARYLACGVKSEHSDAWTSGFFDKGTFVEFLAGWAKTVITGRARLGGIPMGVIITENRTSEALKPADPADASSQEKMVQQAGGVWFPDSAYKTSQALRDFNREGIPCIIFANWRGFSGGQRDMFDEVLKFGSMIVDALVAYQQPLFVYIPPFAELRGGAWVVVDHTINADVMEFYAAENSRGGVLEPAGAASIKFRDNDIIKTAHRVDDGLIGLDIKLATAKQMGLDVSQIEKEIKIREKQLFNVYQQVAVHFADLHDTPGRMQSKGVIRRQVNWKNSRAFFFWRLRRRLTEFDLADELSKNGMGPRSADSRTRVIADLHEWFLSRGGTAEQWEDDKRMLRWLGENGPAFKLYVNLRWAETVAQQLSRSLVSEVTVDNLRQVLRSLPESDRNKLSEALVGI